MGNQIHFSRIRETNDLSSDVIPAEAGLPTAELVIHLLLVRKTKIKLDSRIRGNDGKDKTFRGSQ